MGNLISRAAARDVINTWGRKENENVRMNLLHKDLNAIPAVDAVPVKHGRWVADSDGLPVCSICNAVAMQRLHCNTSHRPWMYDVRLVKTPYCPYCGARMDGK